MTLLAVKSITVRFGGILALDDVSFDVADNSIVGLIGPNGAGKTTLFNVMTRVYTPQSGDILLGDTSLLTTRADRIINLGVARTFQNVELFSKMTVLDNVLVGLHHQVVAGPGYLLGSAFGMPGVRRIEKDARRQALEAIEYVGLAGQAERPVAGLSFGTLKAVELARALVCKPRLLLLDEPAGGLNHDEVGNLVDLLRNIHRDYRTTLLVVEHHMNLVMRVSDRVVCLDFGRKIAEGTPREVQADQRVVDAYLGTADLESNDGAA